MTEYFDSLATEWDNNPVRVELAKSVVEAILAEIGPLDAMDALDYGCGTGLVSLFLHSHVKSLAGADSSGGMLDVLQTKIADGGLKNLRTLCLDLEHEDPPPERYHLIVTNMALHHIANTRKVVGGFYSMLHPGGTLCISDLDTEPGSFHGCGVKAAGVHHHGFDRAELKSLLSTMGFSQTRDRTAYTVRKPIESGEIREFPVFLIAGEKAEIPG
jgi:2-polyprenyl-3-methyl-5-hydroxy-6-metoxy-1,4-benzoquinol methylase